MNEMFREKNLSASQAMDIARRRTQATRISKTAALWIVGAIIIVFATSLGASALRSEFRPAVVKDTVVLDKAARGTLTKTISAQGIFEPQHVRIVSGPETGIVNRVLVSQGSTVSAGTLIVQMQDPQLNENVENATAALGAAYASLEEAKQTAKAAIINEQNLLSDAQAQAKSDELQLQSIRGLRQQGYAPAIQYDQMVIQSRKSSNDVRSLTAQVEVAEADGNARVAAAEAQVREASTALSSAERQAEQLNVKSPVAGVVQTLSVEPGVDITAGTEIARIANMRDLKAVLSVSEADIRDVVIGMPVRLDTGADAILGHISRIAPTAQNGTVATDVSLDSYLPSSVRPDSNAFATITVAKIDNAISIARPPGVLENTDAELFRVIDDGRRAIRVRVHFGQGSANRIQILSGLLPTDTVIVSDMSQYSNDHEIELR